MDQSRRTPQSDSRFVEVCALQSLIPDASTTAAAESPAAVIPDTEGQEQIAAEEEYATALAFWNLIYGPGTGYLALVSGVREENGSLKHPLEHKYFRWPEESALAIEWVASEEAAGREVYHCAHLLTSTRRVKENAAVFWSLFADFDNAQGSGYVEPSILVETSPGKSHAYWLLDRPVSPQEGENLNARLASALGADPSGRDRTQILRIPGTTNHKYPDSPRVRILQQSEVRYDPDELAKLLPPLPTRDGNGAPKLWKETTTGPVPIGKQNEALTSRAGKMARELPEELWDSILPDLRNKVSTWPQDPDHLWKDRDLQTIVDSVCRMERERRAALSAGEIQVPILDGMRTLRDRIEFPTPIPEPLIPDFAWPQTISMFFGPTGVGKTTLLVNLALHVATGHRLVEDMAYGFPVPNKPLRVLYVGAEDSRAMFEAMRLTPELLSYFGMDLTSEASLGFQYLNRRITLAGKDRQLDAFISELLDRPPFDLLILDPIMRFFVGLDENDNGEMAQVMAALDAIREKTGAGIFFGHHTGKEVGRSLKYTKWRRSDPYGARGASVLSDQSHVVISVSAGQGGSLVLTWSKSNYSQLRSPLVLKREPGGVLRPVKIDKRLGEIPKLVRSQEGGVMKRAELVSEVARLFSLSSKGNRWGRNLVGQAEELGLLVRVNKDGELSEDGQFVTSDEPNSENTDSEVK